MEAAATTVSGRVLVAVGSDSDIPRVEGCLDTLSSLGIPWELRITSAHRTPEATAEMARRARVQGFSVIVAAAGGAAHLPGVMAALTTLPVVGLPVSAGPLKGLDAMVSMAQMPSGVPVACVGVDAAANAALLAARVLAVSDPALAARLEEHARGMAARVADKDQALRRAWPQARSE